MEKTEVGKIVHFFSKIGVGIVELSADLKVGDKIAVEGKNNFEQEVKSMQIEHDVIDAGKAGQSIGLKLDQEVKEGDKVFKI